MAKFLDNVGLDHFWQELKGRIQLAARGAIDYITDISPSEIQIHPSGDSSAGININSQVSGDTAMVTTASLVTWNTTASVDATTRSVNDENATTGSTVVTATINGTDHALGSTYANVVVNTGISVDVTLTSSGVTYVRSLMIDDSDPDNIIVSPCSLSVEYMHTVADIVRFTFPGEQIIESIGRAIQLRNSRWTSSNKYETFLSVLNEVTNKGVLFGVGAGGYIRGMFDAAKGDWIICRNEDDDTIINGSKFNVTAGGATKSTYQVQVVGNGTTADTQKQIALRSNSYANRGLFDVSLNKWILFRSSAGNDHLCGGKWYVDDPYNTSTNFKLGDPQRLVASGNYRAGTSDTMGPYVTLTAGKWLVIGNWIFANTSSSAKRLTVGFYHSSTGTAYTYRVHTTAPSNAAHRLEVVDTIIVSAASERMTLYASSDPASTASATQYIIAIRLS